MFSRAVGREGLCKQITLGCGRRVWATLGLPSLTVCVLSLSTLWETWVWEDPLEKEMAIHSSTVAWKIPWTEELGRLQSMGSQRVGHD